MKTKDKNSVEKVGGWVGKYVWIILWWGRLFNVGGEMNNNPLGFSTRMLGGRTTKDLIVHWVYPVFHSIHTP